MGARALSTKTLMTPGLLQGTLSRGLGLRRTVCLHEQCKRVKYAKEQLVRDRFRGISMLTMPQLGQDLLAKMEGNKLRKGHRVPIGPDSLDSSQL